MKRVFPHVKGHTSWLYEEEHTKKKQRARRKESTFVQRGIRKKNLYKTESVGKKERAKRE